MTRHRTSITILRETGLALAMLAVWMLALLAPLHQTSGLLHAMAKTGHVLPGGWSICVALAQEEDGPDIPVSGCPAHALGKTDIALPPQPVALPALVTRSYEPLLRAQDDAPAATRYWQPGQPRAPPAQG